MSNSKFTELLQRLNFRLRRKVPQILQTEAAECGLACLVMLCRYYGFNTDLFTLRRQWNISSHGTTLSHIIDVATRLKFKTRALTLDLDEIRHLKTPCILHWDMNHFVVLVRVHRSSFIIHDPVFGRRKVSEAEMSQHFTGVALELWPDSDFTQEKKRNRLSLFVLMRNINGLTGFLVRIFCLSLIIESITMLLPVGTQLVMDHVILAGDHDLLTLICTGLFVFILFRTFIGMLRAWTSLTTESLIDIQWKSGLFDHLLRLPLSYFEKRRLGDIHARFSSLDTIRTTLTSGIISSIMDSIMVVGLLIMMFLYGAWMTWVVLGFTGVYVLLRLFTYRYFRQASEEHIVKSARASSHFMESLYGIATLRALGIAGIRAQFWLNLNIDTTNANIRLNRLSLFFSGIDTFISTIEQVVVLWIGATMVMNEQMTLGMFVAFSAFRGQFSGRASSLTDMALSIRMLSLHCERISDIVLTETEASQPPRQILAHAEPAALEIRDLAFQYDAFSAPVFLGLNIAVRPGESLAITGVSGTGKTTLMKVMCGLLSPVQGSVLINGFDINSIGLNNYRNCIACVLQEDKLFAGSVAENISSFDADRNEARIEVCARQCNIHDEIMSMPMGYETLISELGGSLSGGQKQRLLIARALYRQPKILFLDEATSHLDIENEAHINSAISALNITRIIIAHRPSTIKSADRALYLDNNSS